ncbi:hypothetical protein H4R18_004982 [Coemansia javaensis]|uniref:Uncharacterized protein n=1 Tax=Coemansia javaensis TaxID=2761396 RepID=A0A9W8H6D2_9FUNG|nr:hypothetical protein H4R18_004982 [Coemansia javaensis]
MFDPCMTVIVRWRGSHAVAADETASGEGEEVWHGAPVFDAGYWHAKGGMELVRQKHGALGAGVEALTIVHSGTEPAEWYGDCLALGWPGVRAIDVEYDAAAVQPDSEALRWLGLAQDAALFPQAELYRLTVRWAGCTEVFEHPLRSPLAGDLAERLALLDQLPPLAGDRALEARFYKYRVLFLAGVSFEMGAMSRTDAGARAMYAYITYLFKTDLFAPVHVSLADAQPQHLHMVLAAINDNRSSLAYDKMRTATGAYALQSSLRRISLDMHNMVDGKKRIIFCAAHFPQLESLALRHSPDFRLPHEDPMSLGVLFSLPWPNLVELCLPFISDQYAKVLRAKCPALQFLLVLPGPRYERWTAYSQTFTPDGLHMLVTQWPEMRQLVVRHAFRQSLQPEDSEYALLSPSRSSFSASRLGNIMGKATTLPLSPDSLPPTPKADALPGTWPRASFAFASEHQDLCVLRMPYLQLPFSEALAMLPAVPRLAVLEFTPTLKAAEPHAPLSAVASTLRRRMSVSPTLKPSPVFADPDTLHALKTFRHPLENMIVHDACTTGYIASAWVQAMNAFSRLAAVTFVATSQDELAIVERIRAFSARNDAEYAVEADDRSRAHQTCLDFANSWGKAAALSSPG